MLTIDYRVNEIRRELEYYARGPLAYLLEYKRKAIPEKELVLMKLILDMDRALSDTPTPIFENMRAAKKIE